MNANVKPKTLPKPVDWDELYPGKFLKAGEFKGKKVTLTMTDVRIEELVGDKGAQIKGVISFQETDKQLALNKTNGICLREMFGRKLSDWVGKKVTLFPDNWDGELCIRVWGSPDIPADKEVEIALPRKRPFTKTMHKVGGAVKAVDNAPAAKTEPGALDAAAAIAVLEEAFKQGKKQLLAAWAKLAADYAGADTDVPLEVEAKFNELKDALQ